MGSLTCRLGAEFLGAQLIGGALAVVLVRGPHPDTAAQVADVALPRHATAGVGADD
jgi:hypothetical protein